MMKKLFNLILMSALVFLVSCSDSSTSTVEEVAVTRPFTTQIDAGTVSGTWNMAGSPYYIDADITIPAGQTLVIEAGVDVHVNLLTTIYVEGTLDVRGELGQMVRFLGNEMEEEYGLWQGIVFREGSDASSLRYAMIAFGSKFNNQDAEKTGAVVCNNSSPLIEHCLIWYNQYNGIVLQGSALPLIRSNIIYENDGSGIAFDTTHVGNTTQITNWLSDSLIVHNNVSANSSLPFRYTADFAAMHWDGADADTLGDVDQMLGSDLTGYDPEGNELFRLNENNDRVDVYGNSVQDAQFDLLEADVQIFNPCSPCIQSSFDYSGGDRGDVGPIVYLQAANELRKRIKDPNLGNAVYTVTCDAFSVDPVVMNQSTVEFAGYFGITFDSGLDATGSSFGPTADRELIAAWKSIEIDGGAGGTVHFTDCTFSLGSESSFAGQDWINAGGMVELRNGAVAELEGCTFNAGNSYGVSAHGAGSVAEITNCVFNDIGLASVYFAKGARGRLSESELHGSGTYGVFFYDTGYFSQVENCLIEGGELYGIKLDDSPGVEILQNTIVGNGYGGIKLDHNVDPLLRHNLIADNDYAGSEIATGIVGTTLGSDLDTNNPDVNVNWFTGNGGDDFAAMPGNWTIGACNDFTEMTIPANFDFAGTIEDCEMGGTAGIGWGAGQVENPGPMLGSIGDLFTYEDNSIEIWLGAVSFGGDDDFTYTVETDLPELAVILDGTHLMLVPDEHWNGAGTLTVTAENGEGMDSETVEIIVEAVNDAPEFEVIATQTISQGGTLEFEILVTDVDDDESDVTVSGELFLIEAITGDDTGHTLEIEDNMLTLSPNEDFSGTLQVNLLAVDGPDSREDRRESRTEFEVVVEQD